MKIVIIGYGRMGQMIEARAKETGHEVSAIIDPSFTKVTEGRPDLVATDITAETLNGAEVAIDFTAPDAVVGNIRKLAELKVNAVIGTTGWYDQLAEVQKIIKTASTSLIYAGNFSIGVQIFYAIAAEAARRLGKAGGYDVGVHEIHHAGKADAPSGTARELANTILENFPAKQKIILDNAEQPISPESLQISSSRIGKVIGVHSAIFDDASNAIEVTHRGKNREGYASGAVAAAEWLAKQKPGVYTAKEWLGI